MDSFPHFDEELIEWERDLFYNTEARPQDVDSTDLRHT